MMPEFVVEVRGLQVRYGDVLAVRGVDLGVAARSIVALMGPSGCGKTSLLRAIGGFEVPAAGVISIAGRQMSGGRAWIPPERRQVGMVFQEGALFPHLSVSHNVAYGVRGSAGADDKVQRVLQLVGMEQYGDRYPDELSGGQQQRVALARALAPSPQIVLLDEPFSSLDSALRVRVREDVHAILRAARATAVLVTHDQEEAMSFADSVAVMQEGKILQVGTPDELYRSPASAAVAQLIGDGQLLSCTIRDGEMHSILGSFSCDRPEGPGLVLLRPEDLVMFWVTEDESDGGTGPYGTVVRRRFFGHDILEDVLMDSGERLSVRMMTAPGLPVGTRVRLRLRHSAAKVFAAESA